MLYRLGKLCRFLFPNSFLGTSVNIKYSHSAPTGDTRGVVSTASDDDEGPTLAYGIMVYQRKGYAVETTLGQFIRMFDAVYDESNM